jgi:hypothetical protein
MRRPIWNDLALVSLPYQVGSDARLSGLIYECPSPLHAIIIPTLQVAYTTGIISAGLQVVTEILYPPKLCDVSPASISEWLSFIYHDEACTFACIMPGRRSIARSLQS